jgi:hypothetical protein
VVTVIFAAYVLCLLLALLTVGSLSDYHTERFGDECGRHAPIHDGRLRRSAQQFVFIVPLVHHRRGHRVRAHVLLCMLAYYLEWHMRQALKPILFDDHDKPASDAARSSIVAKAARSDAAQRKAATQRTHDDHPVHSFQSLIADLATFTRNTMGMTESPDATFLLYPELTRVQERAFQLLEVPTKL